MEPARRGLHPDAAPVALRDLLAQGQSQARAGKLLSAVQTLENGKNPFLVLRSNADAVILHADNPLVSVLLRRNMYPWRFLAPEFKGIGQEILQKLSQLHLIGQYASRRPSQELAVAGLRIIRRLFYE